jgi:plasmid stabilization system protein ParE
MSRVVVTARAERDVRGLIRSRTLPADTPQRIWRVLEPLRMFPELGARLGGRFTEQRFVLGPWRWMIVIYELDPNADTVVILRVLDGRTSTSPLANR